MLLHVTLTMNRGSESFGTVCTFEGSNTAVYHHVSRQGAVCGERGIADLTAVLLDTRVRSHVSFENSGRHKHSSTLQTLVRFFPCKKVLG